MSRRDKLASAFIRIFGRPMLLLLQLAMAPVMAFCSTSARGSMVAHTKMIILSAFTILIFGTPFDHWIKPFWVFMGFIFLGFCLISLSTSPTPPVQPVGWSILAYAGLTPMRVEDELDHLAVLLPVMRRVPFWASRKRRAAIVDRLQELFNEMRSAQTLMSLPGMCFEPAEGIMVYIPEHNAEEKLPVMVVCHGHGGNIAVANWVWAKLADEFGFVALFPSYDIGAWEDGPLKENANKFLPRILQQAFDLYPNLDRERCVLAGLSQGGCGVTSAAKSYPWAGFVFVSAVLDDEYSLPPGKPVFVWQGTDDINVRVQDSDATVAMWRELGSTVTYCRDPGDHFLFLEKHERLIDLIQYWWRDHIVQPQ
jgi:predicted esterase